ncbi:MAG: vWA domain-containing protein [Planctomycetota bacterium]|jgi:hypothetical protein
MLSIKRTGFVSAAIIAVLCLSLLPSSTADAKDKRKNPDIRAKEIENAARHNSKDSAKAIMKALAVEDDGPAGFRMSNALSALDSPEALEVVKDTIMKWTKPQQLMGAFWVFRGLAMQRNASADAVIRTAVLESKDKEIYLKAAALEAVADAERKEFGDLYIETLKLWDKDWQDKNSIIALTLADGAKKVVSKETLHPMVLGLADALEKCTDERIRWYIVQSLSKMTGEDTYITPGFWRFWVKAGGKKTQGEDDGPTSAGADVPKFFKARAVGKRVVFVIDISGSMQHPVNLPPEMRKRKPVKKKKKKKREVTGETKKEKEAREKAEEEEENKIDPPDYSKVKSKLDLAKVELIHTLKHLPEDYTFNVVIYHTVHSMLINSQKQLVKATKANKGKFVKAVEKLNWASLTNIHGALTRGFCVNEKKTLEPFGKKATSDPSWDPNCLNFGATTMFFLTDGSPTISDDTTNKGEVGRPNAAGQVATPVGNGRMCNPNNIVMDVKRLNVFRKVVINTIGIGPHNSGLMSALAEMTGGEYVDRSGR